MRSVLYLKTHRLPSGVPVGLRSSLGVLAALFMMENTALPREIHVAKTGSDSNGGDAAAPYGTINRAAQVAEPGDMVVIQDGVYRERINPARGGLSDVQRITYRAANRGKAIVKGSELVTQWKLRNNPDDQHDKGLWRVELPDSRFGGYNPFRLNVYGNWLNYGEWRHRGAVYLKGEPLSEMRSLAESKTTPKSWFSVSLEDKIILWANFGDVDPNNAEVEINARESLFFPDKPQLAYITIDGLKFQHSAENWAPPGSHQKGAIVANWGKDWIIENCEITDAKCVGISLGYVPGISSRAANLADYGRHLVRNNQIRRCGQSGIAGHRGAGRSIIEGNLVEEINYRAEFGGWETAAIKFHAPIDTIIRNNCIRKVRGPHSGGAFGIWLDWEAQGTRISGNVIYDTEWHALYLEVNHGPILVDNNLIQGGGIFHQSEGCVFAHNLFLDCPITFQGDQRVTPYYQPHSALVAGRKNISPCDSRWFNNLFFRKGLEPMKEMPGSMADANAFLGGAQKGFYDAHSLVLNEGEFFLREVANGIKLMSTLPAAVLERDYPQITPDLMGKVSLVNQGIESPDGTPITIDTDILRTPRSPGRQVPGPLGNLRAGANEVLVWPAN